MSTIAFRFMPELPDITIYIEALEKRIGGQRLEGARVSSPFVLRTFEPAIREIEGKTVREIRRLGKRIAIGLDDDLWLVIHLMIAGRLHWKPKGARTGGKQQPGGLRFPDGTPTLTEAGSKRRASIHVLRGESSLREHDPGGLEVLSATLEQFRSRLQQENHTRQAGPDGPASVQRHRQRLLR